MKITMNINIMMIMGRKIAASSFFSSPTDISPLADRVGGGAHSSSNRRVGGAGGHHKRGEIQRIIDRLMGILGCQALVLATLQKKTRQASARRVTGGVENINTDSAQGRVLLPLVGAGAENGHFDGFAASKILGGTDDSLILAFGQNNVATHCGRTVFECFEKLQVPSSADIVPQRIT